MGRLIIQDGIADDIAAYADAWISRLGLDEWDIWLFQSDTPGNEQGNAGHTVLNTRYLRSEITLMRGLAPERVRSVIRHELLHVALAFIDQAMRYLVMKIPQEDRDLAREMYIDSEEQTIERLARALADDPAPAEPNAPAPAAN